MRGSNPALQKLGTINDSITKPSTYLGVSVKTLILLGIVIITATITSMVSMGTIGDGWMVEGLLFGMDFLVLLFLASIGAFVSVLIATIVPKAAAVCAPIYAVCEGLMIGFTSALFEAIYSGIVFCAMLSTIITFCVMLFIYRLKIVKVNSTFKRILFTALISITISQLLFLILTLLFPGLLANFAASFWLQLLVSSIMVIVASMCILND
jgi:Predicted membrane protein